MDAGNEKSIFRSYLYLISYLAFFNQGTIQLLATPSRTLNGDMVGVMPIKVKPAF